VNHALLRIGVKVVISGHAHCHIWLPSDDTRPIPQLVAGAVGQCPLRMAGSKACNRSLRRARPILADSKQGEKGLAAAIPLQPTTAETHFVTWLPQSPSSPASGMWVKATRMAAWSRLSCTLPKLITLRRERSRNHSLSKLKRKKAARLIIPRENP